MGAIKNRKSGLKDPDRLYARYSGVSIVYVESDEDQYVFGDCWFKEDSARIEFKPVSHRNESAAKTASGCNAVINAVSGERQSGNPAWGIVDRDAVFSHRRWDLVHETSDEVFDGSLPFGQHVKVLRRWEMESYLIDVVAIEKCRGEHAMENPRSDEAVWAELLVDCQALIPHAALNAVHHEFHQDGIGDGRTDSMAQRADVDAKLVRPVLTSLARSHPTCQERYDDHLKNADAFDRPEQPDSVRVASLLRRVHGKAMLSRFETRHQLRRLKGALAARIKEADRIPDELRDFVRNVLANGARVAVR